MRYSTSGMVLAALCVGEAVAGPAHAHAHLHKKAHLEKKDVDWSALNWNDMGIDWSSAWAAGQHTSTAAAVVAATSTAVATHAAATTTAAAVVAATSSASASQATTTSSSSSSSGLSLFKNLVGLSNSLASFGKAYTATSGSEISYIGNIGVPQGSNMIKVASRTGYDYTNEFINTSGEDMTIVIWNKAYDMGENNGGVKANAGASMAPTSPILTFALAAGESQIVAFQEDSQIGWCQAVSAMTVAGQFATTWGEMNFRSTGSGYDVSAIMNPNNNNYDMTITSAEAPSCTSSRTENFWLTETDPVGDSNGSCYIAQSTATITTKMGGTI